jgi:hypothetical protein
MYVDRIGVADAGEDCGRKSVAGAAPRRDRG